MRVLVTGASGLLGGAVARAVAAAGHEVTTFQRRPSGVAGVRDVAGSMTDAAVTILFTEPGSNGDETARLPNCRSS